MVECRSGFEKGPFLLFQMTGIRENLRHERGALKAKLYTPRTQLYAVYLRSTWQKHWGAWLLSRSLESIPVWQKQRKSIMTHIHPLTEHKAIRLLYSTWSPIHNWSSLFEKHSWQDTESGHGTFVQLCSRKEQFTLFMLSFFSVGIPFNLFLQNKPRVHGWYTIYTSVAS